MIQTTIRNWYTVHYSRQVWGLRTNSYHQVQPGKFVEELGNSYLKYVYLCLNIK